LSIYKPCDIRGVAGTELEPEFYRRWGRGLGLQVAPKAKFVIGGDVRRSTPEFLAALADGLCRAGVDVINLDVLTTPMIYYAKRRLQAAACAIVTASHNPAETNGLKWLIGERPPTADGVAELERAARSSNAKRSRRPRTEARYLDISFDYVAWLQERWVDWMGAQLRVVLDPMHGCCACRARRYLQAVFPHSLFVAIHDAPDPSFAGRSPDCSRSENLEELAEAVYRERADLGIAFDGDGDRIALVDNEGNLLTAEEATWVLLASFGRQLRRRSFVHDVKFSDCIPRRARKLGAEPVAERSGHTFLRTRMLETGALFGAEVSGHYFFEELGAGDDGLFAACRVIAHLAQGKKSLAKLRRACPPVFVTPDLRVALPPGEHDRVLRRVRQSWSQRPQTFTDGVRIDFPKGWALVRSSVTEPAVTFRFEADRWPSLSRLVRRFCEALPGLGADLWTQFAATTGHAHTLDALEDARNAL